MATIHIKNIGPLKDTGPIELTRITLLLGPQGSGKSTFLKILCHIRWVEKQLMIKAKKVSDYSAYKRFYKSLIQFYPFDKSFFSSQSEVLYDGDCYSIYWVGGVSKNASIKKKTNSKAEEHNPKISFVPAERNLLSVNPSYRDEFGLLLNFLLEFGEAKRSYVENKSLPLSIDDDFEFYHKEGDNLIRLKRLGLSIRPKFASSGIQSAFPIDVISSYLYSCIGELSQMTTSIIYNLFSSFEDEKRTPKDVKIHKYSSMQLYVEEPEQNLYPEAQKNLLLRLVELLYKAKKDKETHPSSIIITTHSPYILSVLNTQINISREIEELKETVNIDSEQSARLKNFVEKFLPNNNPVGGYLPLSDYSAYFVGKDGKITSLIDADFPMVDGTLLDGVSDWVEEFNTKLYSNI